MIVKHKGSIFVREIDPRTASKLRQMPTLATSPEAMLEALNQATVEQPQMGAGPAYASVLPTRGDLCRLDRPTGHAR